MIVANAVRNWHLHGLTDYMRYFSREGYLLWFWTGAHDMNFAYQLTQGSATVIDGFESKPDPTLTCDKEHVLVLVELWMDRCMYEEWALTGTGPSNGGYRHAENVGAFRNRDRPGYYIPVNKCVPPGPYKFEILDGCTPAWSGSGEYRVSVTGEVLAEGNQREIVHFSVGAVADCDGSWFLVNGSIDSWDLLSSRLCDGTVIEKHHVVSTNERRTEDTFGPICKFFPS